MGLVKTRRLAAMQKQEKAKAACGEPEEAAWKVRRAYGIGEDEKAGGDEEEVARG